MLLDTALYFLGIHFFAIVNISAAIVTLIIVALVISEARVTLRARARRVRRERACAMRARSRYNRVRAYQTVKDSARY